MNYRKNAGPKPLVSGIAVSRETIIDQTNYYDDEKGNVILLLILLLLGSYGFVGALLTDFGIHGHNFLIYLLVLILCLLFSAVLYFEDYIKYTMPATLLLLVAFVVSFYDRIFIGYHKTFSEAVNFLNSEYSHSFRAPIDLSRRPYELEMLLFLMTATFLICWLLSVWVIYRPRASFIFFLYCPLLFVEVITGMRPSPVFLGLILFCVLGTAVRGRVRTAFQQMPSIGFLSRRTQNNHLEDNEFYLHGMQLRVILYQGPLILAAAAVIFAAGIFPANALFSANQDAMKAAVEASLIGGTVRSWTKSEYNPLSFLFSDKGIGGIGDGTLGKVGYVQYSGKTALVVKTSSAPAYSIYLKAFTGDLYGKNRWNPSSIEQNYYEYDAPGYASPVTDHNKYYYAITNNSSTEITSIDININNVGANTSYTYLPYFSFLEEYEDSYKAIAFADIPDYYDGLRTVQEDISGYYDDRDFIYELYALPEYLQLPDSGLERLKKQCEETGYYGTEDLPEITRYIIETLHSTTSYSLSPGVLPRGEEFTEYFLYEHQEGYCTHYATAATLMYRMFGIPARYVMGYRIPYYMFNRDSIIYEDAASAYVRDEQAHAWPEIYLTGLGWVPIEVTPADSNSAWIEYTTDESENSQSTDNATGDDDQAIFSISLLKTLSALTVILTVTFLALILHRNIRTYGKRFRKPDMALPNEGIRQIYINLYQIFIFTGLSKTDCLSEAELFQYIQEHFPFIERQQFSHFMDLVLQANYSNHQLSEQDTHEAAAIYDNCRRHLLEQLSWHQKIRFRLLCPEPR